MSISYAVFRIFPLPLIDAAYAPFRKPGTAEKVGTDKNSRPIAGRLCFLLIPYAVFRIFPLPLIDAAYALFRRPSTAETINSVSMPSAFQIHPPVSAMRTVIM